MSYNNYPATTTGGQQQQQNGGQQQQQPWHQNAPGTHQPQQHQQPAQYVQPSAYDPATKPADVNTALMSPANNEVPAQQQPYYQQQPYQPQQPFQPQQPYQPQHQQRPYGMNQYGFMRTPDFKQQLFGCFDDLSVCCEAYWCRYCQVASQYNKVEKNIADIDWGVCAGMACLDMCCGGSGLALCIGTLIVRGKIRARYNINPGGQDCEDCMSVWCCMCCAVAQQHREMTSLGQYPGGIFTTPPQLAPRQHPQMGTEAGGIYQQQPQQQYGGGKQL